jgi:hypothetical protein
MRMGGMTISYTANGEFDFAHGRGTLSMQAPVGMTELFLPPKLYLKLPGAALPKGKTWVELDTKGIGGSALAGLGDAFGVSSSPADELTSLTAISSSVTKLGAGSVRGVAVTGFRVIIDPRKAVKAAKVPAAERASYQQFVSTLGSGAISADVWVDAANLVRRVTLSLKLPAALTSGLGDCVGSSGASSSGASSSAGSGVSCSGGAGNSAPAGNSRMTQTTDYYDFGVQVRLSPPPAAQVASTGSFFYGSGGVYSASGSSAPSSTPPPVSGTLTQAQATAAEQAVTAFFTALGHNNATALEQTVVPSQRGCVASALNGAPKITVKSLRIISAAPAGTGKATVRFTVSATASLSGTDAPVVGPGSGDQQWMVTVEEGGHWYADLQASAPLSFTGPC